MSTEKNQRVAEAIDYGNLTTTTSVVYANTEQELIIVTRDKLHLCLQGAIDRMASRDRWMVPLGVLVPLVLTVTTTAFSKRFGVDGGEWETVYIMLILFTLSWLASTLFKRPRSVSVTSVVDELAKNPVLPSSPTNAPAVDGSHKAGSEAGTLTPEQARARARRILTLSANEQVTRDAHEAEATRKATSDGPLPRDLASVRRINELTLKPGDQVVHNSYGIGTVRKVMGELSDQEALIDFGPTWGTKHLVLRYAPLVKRSE